MIELVPWETPNATPFLSTVTKLVLLLDQVPPNGVHESLLVSPEQNVVIPEIGATDGRLLTAMSELLALEQPSDVTV